MLGEESSLLILFFLKRINGEAGAALLGMHSPGETGNSVVFWDLCRGRGSSVLTSTRKKLEKGLVKPTEDLEPKIRV